jgi:hypothetical protein
MWTLRDAGGHHDALSFNFLHSVWTMWRACKRLRCDSFLLAACILRATGPWSEVKMSLDLQIWSDENEDGLSTNSVYVFHYNDNGWLGTDMSNLIFRYFVYTYRHIIYRMLLLKYAHVIMQICALCPKSLISAQCSNVNDCLRNWIWINGFSYWPFAGKITFLVVNMCLVAVVKCFNRWSQRHTQRARQV